jgi:integrin alpha FG-GAP repeat containing protein 1
MRTSLEYLLDVSVADVSKSLSTDLPFNQPEKLCTLAEPHSNAYIDLNGDCLPGKQRLLQNLTRILTERPLSPTDIFLTCQGFGGTGERSFQIWTNNKSEGYNFAGEWDLPEGAGAISFADMGKFSVY